MSKPIFFGDRSGISVEIREDGIRVAGWYDGMVGIAGGVIPWETIDRERARASGKKPRGG